MRRDILVKFNTIDKVKSFVNITTQSMCDVDLCSGRYVIDAKSIMGIFSMNLSNDLILVINGITEDEIDTLVEKLKKINVVVK